MRRGVRAATPWLLALAAPVAGPASGATTTWQPVGHAQVRLLAAGAPSGSVDRLAAIEIKLEPGYLTYWRNPGEAGLPPTIDTSASRNVAAVRVDYPAPKTFDEGGVKLFGYSDAVTFPMHVVLRDATQPVALDVALDFAVCAKLCLPGHATLALELTAAADPTADKAIADAESLVPRPKALAAPGPLGIETVAPATADGKAGFSVLARASQSATLFVDPPDGWYLSAGAPQPADGGKQRFSLTVEQRPASATTQSLSLRLTLVDGEAAIETPVHVDVAARKP